MSATPLLHIGTAGWSYKDWVPSFYPKQQSATFDWLQFYASHFNCVEVNSTYYTFIAPKIVEGWIEKVEGIDDFLFTIKLHQDFTHKRVFDNIAVKSVSVNLTKLAKAERLGGLLLQFPYSFAYNETNLRYIIKLSELFSSFKIFLEVRHITWKSGDVIEVLSEKNISLCTIDQPEIGKAVDFAPMITNDTAYFRFHGRNVDEWKKSIASYGKKHSYEEQNARYLYRYSAGELAEVVQKIRSVYDKVSDIYIIMNNHPQGYAVTNGKEIMQMLNLQLERGKKELF